MTEGSIICSRVQSPLDGPLDTFRHRRRGMCECGTEHGSAPVAFNPQPRQKQAAAQGPRIASDKPAEPVRTIDYPIRDTLGMTVAIHRRLEFADGSKTFRFMGADGRMGLGGVSSRDLPLYGSEDIRTWPDGCTIILVEGETTRDWLKERRFRTLAVASGASNCPNPAVWECLKGHPIVQWPDADEAGIGLMDAAAAHLHAQGNDVWRLDVSAFTEIKKGYDAADWTGTVEELRAYMKLPTFVAPPVTEADAPAAVAEASTIANAAFVAREQVQSRYIELCERVGWHERAVTLGTCYNRWRPAFCIDCKGRPAYVMTCHDVLCPRCAPGRFFGDWKQKQSERLAGEYFTTVRYVPDERISLKQARNRFTEARGKAYVQGGIVGVRWSAEHGAVILLAVPQAVAAPERMGTFTVQPVRELQSERQVASWLWSEYEAETAEAVREDVTDAEFKDWVNQTQGRKRFTGFGSLYPAYSPIGTQDVNPGMEEVPEEPEPIKLGGVSGGGGSGGGKHKDVCPFCGSSNLKTYAMRVSSDRITHERGHPEWILPGS